MSGVFFSSFFNIFWVLTEFNMDYVTFPTTTTTKKTYMYVQKIRETTYTFKIQFAKHKLNVLIKLRVTQINRYPDHILLLNKMCIERICVLIWRCYYYFIHSLLFFSFLRRRFVTLLRYTKWHIELIRIQKCEQPAHQPETGNRTSGTEASRNGI